MSKHTQEEWRAEPDGDHLMVCTDLLEICTIQPVDRGGVKYFYLGDETIANARLIAAAPELFALVEMVYLSFGGGRIITFSDEDIEEFGAVIAKARGE